MPTTFSTQAGSKQASCQELRAAYAAAAGAALSAGAVPAQAAVQYFTGDIEIPSGVLQPLDFNLDEYTDINLKNYVFLGGNYQGAFIPYVGGALVGFVDNAGPNGTTLNYASALGIGALVDQAAVGPFVASLAYGEKNPSAQFQQVQAAYLGFRFPAGDQLHYAWVRIDVDNAAGTFFVRDWAYEDQSGVPILTGQGNVGGDLDGNGAIDGADLLTWQQHAGGAFNQAELQGWEAAWNASSAAAAPTPEPGTLGLLAAGAAGLQFHRRRRRA